MRSVNFRKIIAAVLTASFAVSLAACGSSGDKLARQGEEQYSEGNYSQALSIFLDAEKSGLKNYKIEELYSCIGNCYFQLDDYDKSIEYQTKCLEGSNLQTVGGQRKSHELL